MANAPSPQRTVGRDSWQHRHGGKLAGYCTALEAAYAIEPLPPHMQRLLDELSRRDEPAKSSPPVRA